MTLFGTCSDQCRPQAVSLLVKIGNNFICRYTNCNRVHAEQLMVNDVSLINELHTSLHPKMNIFLKFQPCHFSAGNARRFPDGYLFNGNTDDRSCTLIIIDFFRHVLCPLGKKLTIHIASLYKAHWEFSKRTDDKTTVQNAIDGCNMLLTEGIKLKGMRPRDWLFLARQTTDVKPSQLFGKTRFLTDQGTDSFLKGLVKKKETKTEELEKETTSRKKR